MSVWPILDGAVGATAKLLTFGHASEGGFNRCKRLAGVGILKADMELQDETIPK